jgi:AraC family L-rhamnose operon regulatory protein RhaS
MSKSILIRHFLGLPGSVVSATLKTMAKIRNIFYKAGVDTLPADDCRPLVQAVREGHIALHALARGQYPGDRLKPGEVPGVRSLGFWHVTGEPRQGLASHCNEGIELTCALQGETPVRVEGRAYTLHPGEIMITRPWQPHSVGESGFAKGKLGWIILDVGVRHPHQTWQWPAWVNLHKGDLDTLTHSLRQNEDAIRTASPELRASFERLVTIPTSPSPMFCGSRIAVAVCDVLLRLLDLFHLNPMQLRPALMESSRSVRLFVEGLEGRPIPQSVEAMAEACGLGVTRFAVLFKEVTGSTPGEYLLRRRLDEACRLLKATPPLSVEAVSRRVGFSHGNYFARVFRRTFGTTPSKWRNSSVRTESPSRAAVQTRKGRCAAIRA